MALESHMYIYNIFVHVAKCKSALSASDWTMYDYKYTSLELCAGLV